MSRTTRRPTLNDVKRHIGEIEETLAGAAPTIRFYRANERPYGALSNLYKRPIKFEDVVYPTAEHAYQAGKALKASVRDWIQAAPTPALAAMAAHGLYTWEVVPDWARIKFERMRRVLHAKFTQHSDLAELLLSTGNARLVETATVNNAVNRLWGEVNGRGENTLGLMLMELRQALAIGGSHAHTAPRQVLATRKQTNGSSSPARPRSRAA